MGTSARCVFTSVSLLGMMLGVCVCVASLSEVACREG